MLNRLASSKMSILELPASSNTPLKDFIVELMGLYRDDLISADESGFSLTDKGRALVNKGSRVSSRYLPSRQGKRITLGLGSKSS